jgi:hypothetical protein
MAYRAPPVKQEQNESGSDDFAPCERSCRSPRSVRPWNRYGRSPMGTSALRCLRAGSQGSGKFGTNRGGGRPRSRSPHPHQPRCSIQLVFHPVNSHATATLHQFIRSWFLWRSSRDPSNHSSGSGAHRCRTWRNRSIPSWTAIPQVASRVGAEWWCGYFHPQSSVLG